MQKSKIAWVEDSTDIFYLRNIKKRFSSLPVAVYRLEIDAFEQMYLKRVSDDFEFSYKIYGLEKRLIERTVKSFANTTGNLGILLNGLKGTGKTVTSKMVCNALKMPVVMVDSPFQGCHVYLNDIPQDITIFIDEYEKIFEDDSSMLTIMDGALNSVHRRVFVLTTNKLFVNENLLQRPGRIRYLKTFKDLPPSIIEEIVDDVLVKTDHKKATIEFISQLEMITVDVVKAICAEVNIFDESPEQFGDIFNVKKITGKHDIYEVGEKGKETLFKKAVKIGPRPEFNDETEGRSFYIDGEYAGHIEEVVDETTIKVSVNEEVLEILTDSQTGKGRKKKKSEKKIYTFHIEETPMYHSSYRNWDF